LAEGLSEKGKLHTIECDDELEDFIRKNFKESPYNEQIELHIGDAKNIIYDLHDTFDLIFIDADKREYQTYYDAVFPKLRPGGFMLIDNTLWNDKVLDEDGRRDKQTAAILAFNENIARDTRIEKLILPLRDGLTLIRKK
jgi:predicted O-methyltransferase YrrM